MATTANLMLNAEADYLDTAVSNTARIFDYLLGGTANFEADREAAETMLTFIPALRQWIRLHRAFSQEAAYTLYQNGFKQFLDLGSGMPTENHLHIAVPRARIIYSDTNPVAVSYGQSLFAEFMHIDYVWGGFGQIEQLLDDPALRRLIDQRDKVAIGLNTLPLTLTRKQFRQLLQSLYDWAPPDSRIFLVTQTRAEQMKPRQYKKFLAASKRARCPIYIRPLGQVLALTQPWQLLNRQPLDQFLGLPANFLGDTNPEGLGVAFHAAFLTNQRPD